MDADDKIEPQLLEVLATEFLNGADCIVYGLKKFWAEKYEKTNDGEGRIVYTGEQEKEPLRLLLKGKTIQSVVCKAFNKKLVDIEKLEAYPRVYVGEDALHSLQIYSNATKTIFLEKKLYLYRQNPQSMTRKLKYLHYTENVFKIRKRDTGIKNIY